MSSVAACHLGVVGNTFTGTKEPRISEARHSDTHMRRIHDDSQSVLEGSRRLPQLNADRIERGSEIDVYDADHTQVVGYMATQ
jgi:hypothetical protein